jgi:hypothetical protein
MIDLKVLKFFGTSNEQLRRFFLAKPSGKGSNGEDTPADALYESKVKFTEWLSGVIEDGRMHCFRTYRHFASVDLMKDAPPILPENIAITAYAQGKINIETCQKELESLKCADKFIDQPKPQESDQNRDIKPSVNLPRLHEVCVNMPRAFIKRRVDAQCNKYNSLRPFMKFDTRSTTMVAKLRAEAMSQYSEIMTDQFGYRHLSRQCILDMLNYGHTVQFPAGAWDSDTQTAIAEESFDGEIVEAHDLELPDGEQKPRLKTVVTREGVKMINVHPARVIYDTAHPLATLNTDTGCRWVGFFDVQRFGEIRDNPDFYNTDQVLWSTSGRSVIDQNRTFFDLIFPGQTINFPSQAKTETVDLAAQNERAANRHIYAKTDDENAVFVTDIRVRVIPKKWGMGKYPQPVWLRLVVAGDDTVIFAEWLPSLPAVVWSHNEDDLRLLSLGEAHQLMPWQDQLNNIFSQLLLKMKHSLFRVILCNSDVIPATIVKQLRAQLDSPKYYTAPHLLEVSFKEQGDALGLELDKVFKVISAASNQDDSEFINNAFKAIVQILSIMERLLNLSPQEQGQPMPRESTAEEIAALENSTQVTYNAIGQSCDEARGAWKRIIYESSMAFGSKAVYLPVSQRFDTATIEAAGFEIEKDEDTADSAAKKGRTIIGTTANLVHDYVWTTRDGGDRFTNREGANVLVSLLGQVLPLIGPEAFGKKRIFDIVNEVFRMLASYDLKLEIAEGENDSVMAPQVEQKLQELQQALQEQQQETGGLTEAVQKIAEVLKEIQAMMPAQASSAPQPQSMLQQ